MGVLYQSGGRAKEYCEWAVNLYENCSYGCLYCYAPLVLHKTREEFMKALPPEMEEYTLAMEKLDSLQYANHQVRLQLAQRK